VGSLAIRQEHDTQVPVACIRNSCPTANAPISLPRFMDRVADDVDNSLVPNHSTVGPSPHVIKIGSVLEQEHDVTGLQNDSRAVQIVWGYVRVGQMTIELDPAPAAQASTS